MVPLHLRAIDELLAEAIVFHGHACPGQVLGVRMAQAGCREVGVDDPRAAGKSLVVFVEIDRCATDAIEALTGVSLGKRTLKHVDLGKTAATFVSRVSGTAVRIVARDDAREAARRSVPGEPDPRRAQMLAYRDMPEPLLLDLQRVTIAPGWLDRSRLRVRCDACGEGVTYGRERHVTGRVLCGACSGDGYYHYDGSHTASRALPLSMESVEAITEREGG